jgi:ornithine carbamoyltransferase
LEAVLKRAAELKAAWRAGDASYQPLKGKSLAMIFAKPSLRTRVSFEVVRC